MKLIIDANILFSALLKDGGTRKLWFNPDFELIAPAQLVVEFSKYRSELRSRFDGSDEEFDDWLNRMLSQVRFVSNEELVPFLPAAESLITDSKDWLYLACALKEDAIIWSQDVGFNQQKRIIVKNTKEMMEEFGRL